jgi:hypothetical protein
MFFKLFKATLLLLSGVTWINGDEINVQHVVRQESSRMMRGYSLTEHS